MKTFYAAVVAAIIGGFLGAGVGTLTAPTTVKTVTVTHTRTVTHYDRHLNIYIENEAPRFISNQTILHDIPAWEQAANKDLAPVWGTPQVRLSLVTQAPKGGVTAVFKKSGPIQGALAFHYAPRGAAGIVVYAGVDDFYGFSNSVSFTHELFELLADRTISQTNQGWPYPTYEVGKMVLPQAPGTVWSNEVCDAVEAYAYRINGVAISDFITPNWFNDHFGNGGYDFMNVAQQPFYIARGGYGAYWDGSSWNVVENFRGVPGDPAGFFKAERDKSVFANR